MENFSVKKVSSKTYNKKRNKALNGVTVKKKSYTVNLKHNAFNIVVPLLFYLIIFSLCAAATKIRPLWQSTLIKPSFILSGGIYALINMSVALIMIYMLYMSFIKKDRAQILSLIVNGVITALLFYMFFGLASPLGSIVIITVLLIQTATIFSGNIKLKRKQGLLLLPLLLWQVYNLLLIYTILMLN